MIHATASGKTKRVRELVRVIDRHNAKHPERPIFFVRYNWKTARDALFQGPGDRWRHVANDDLRIGLNQLDAKSERIDLTDVKEPPEEIHHGRQRA
jgi:hypothetical protein